MNNVPNTRRGFTLIELLVVVLIIGILSAIALPQYQKAVFKSRVTHAIVYVKSVHDAQTVYYLANGHYANSAEDLDIQPICPDNWLCNMSSVNARARNEADTFAINYYNDHALPNDDESAELNGVLYCYAQTADKLATEICKSMGPVTYGNAEAKVRHRLN